MRTPPQINRLILLTLAIIVSYLVARYFLTPATFGQYGWYRGASLGEVASATPVYAGKKACDECHSEVLELLGKGKHQTLTCEACHGVSSPHAANPDVLPVKMSGSHCIRCHEMNVSRPAWFKQIVVKEHYEGKCSDCHVPHNPTEVPEEEEKPESDKAAPPAPATPAESAKAPAPAPATQAPEKGTTP